ncbi:MAG: TonB-dependent receptor [Prolixibacteraceae bacterium]|nr:TonB-dependent receptor [Prolixibacteraceae bacterium]
MKKETKNLHQSFSLHINRLKILKTFLACCLIVISGLQVFSQESFVIKGKVTDDQNNPVVGATVVLKGKTTVGTVADANGEFELEVPTNEPVLQVSFIGMETREVKVSAGQPASIVLTGKSVELLETIVVGYGQQRKESVVGAISQTKGEVLERAGGVSNIGAALTGNIPGLITIQGTGEPGDEDPTIYIRGQGTWNYSNPLILVDGIERTMEGLDISSVESISVLKDASATAVFGVKGANGVVLITTKRGSEKRATISINANTTMKIPSKLPNKYDAYDALRIRNMAVENELGIDPSSWEYITPIGELEKYRNPSSVEEAEIYPNVDWQEESFKDYAMSYNTNLSINGGSSFVKYFTAVDYLHEGDVLKVRDNGKGYTPGYGYNRINFRSNLDFNLTKSTTLAVNLFGSHAIKEDTWSGYEYTIWQSAYTMAPDIFPVQYSDGYWGYWLQDVQALNSVRIMSNSGVRKVKTTNINTDFTLKQDLDFIVKGLSAKGTLSMDNSFVSQGGIYDNGSAFQKLMTPDGEVYYRNNSGDVKYDYVLDPWSVRSDEMNNNQTRRKLFYQLQLNYQTKINLHEISAMGLFSRDEYATGNQFPNYREDWVFRTTYNYASRYFVEFNGSYNGSEKFSSDYRFDFFPSAAVGWMLSNEPFMKNLSWLDIFKIRGSYGLVGNDNISGRWLYQTQWAYGGVARLGSQGSTTSPYTWYTEDVIGNPDIHWETVEKANVGVEYALFNGLVSGSFDFFKDYRYDILIDGSARAIPDYFGGEAPTANLGETEVKGYEAELKINHRFSNGLRLWANASMTHAKDIILERDEPLLLPAYQKQQGYQIGQYRSQLLADYYNTWDEVYGSTMINANDNQKLPGNFNLIDFNGDGVIDDYDSRVPNGYPERPQNTYNLTVGVEFKGFSAFVQFYGVNNVTRYVHFSNFPVKTNAVFDQGTYWSKDNTNADSFVPRWATVWENYGNYYAYDGSYLRLKNAEIAYTLDSSKLKLAGISSLRFFLNGNNLLLWTQMPDDRESNLGAIGGMGTYPSVRRINLGVNIIL